MADFKFQLGDLVSLKSAIAELNLSTKIGDELLIPRVAMIVERVRQECPGGEQLHYRCSLRGQVSNHLEIELVAFHEVAEAIAAISPPRLRKP